MNSITLTSGGIATLLANGRITPTLQINNIRLTKNGEKYIVLLSDGVHLATSLTHISFNQWIVEERMKIGSIISVKQYSLIETQGQKLIFVKDIDVIRLNSQMIGQPVVLTAPKQSINTRMSGSATLNNQPVISSHESNIYSNAQTVPYGGGSNYNQRDGSTYGSSMPRHGQIGSNVSTSSNVYGAVQPIITESRYTLINELNPYQNRWTIKARITNKTDIKKWTNQKGEGLLASIDLLDESGEIRGTFFNEAVDRFYDILQVGKVYSFSGGKIKPANKKFTSLKHDYEVTFNSDCEIIVLEDDKKIKTASFEFTDIADLPKCQPNDMVDVIGILKSYSDVASITTKFNKEVERRNVTLVDDSGAEVGITLWGSHAKCFSEEDLDKHPVIGFKSIRVTDFNNCSLNTVVSTKVIFEPDAAQTTKLLSWWASQGKNQSFVSMTASMAGTAGGRGDMYDPFQRVTLDTIKMNNLGFGDKPDYVKAKVHIAYIKYDSDKDPWYTACPLEGCNKKVIQEMDQGWYCEKCNKSVPNCIRRYILNISVMDCTGHSWVTAFNDVAVSLLDGQTADDIQILKEVEKEKYEKIFREACWKQYIIKMRIKKESVGDEDRVKCTLMSAEPVDFVKESKALLSLIASYD